jgi:hypothetical protein
MMTEQDIYKMASESGFADSWFEKAEPGYPAKPREGMLVNFASLVLDHCLKCLAERVEQNKYTAGCIQTSYNPSSLQQYNRGVDSAIRDILVEKSKASAMIKLPCGGTAHFDGCGQACHGLLNVES